MAEPIRGVARLVALTLVALLVPGIGPPSPASADACPVSTDRLQVTASTTLDRSCTYGGIDITASDVTLNCKGATVSGPTTGGQVGIVVRVPLGASLAHVTVRDCKVRGFLNSLRVTREGFRDLAVGHEYDHSTSDIQIVGNSFTGSRGVGVYVDGYVSDVTVRANEIRGAGSSGIYLETGSRRNRLQDNLIADNGFTENGPGGQPFAFRGGNLWFWGVGREGISVDGSYENTITGNTLTGNSAGGIFLYKNCGEYPDSGRYFERRYPAARNRIAYNSFTGGRNGVWVGSRMGENTLPMACTDPAYVSESFLRVVLDRADHNVIDHNQFVDVTYGVRVEDDDTTVSHNFFRAAAADHHAVIIGTPWRTDVLGQPVRGTVLTGNASTIAGNSSPYRWVVGEADTVQDANLALGRRVRICEAPRIPRESFIFVIALAFANPDGTAPPRPDITVPTLGSLRPCQGLSPRPPARR